MIASVLFDTSLDVMFVIGLSAFLFFAAWAILLDRAGRRR